jgi:hypothetical protein
MYAAKAIQQAKLNQKKAQQATLQQPKSSVSSRKQAPRQRRLHSQPPEPDQKAPKHILQVVYLKRAQAAPNK